MNIEKSATEDVFEYANFCKDDVILYLGGRIDDDKLYPPNYASFLNDKISDLKPNKIICHNHWYAKKYYQKGVLSSDTKIDMIFVYYPYLVSGNLQMINPIDYEDHRDWMRLLIQKNPNIVYTMYISEGNKPPSVSINKNWFTADYDFKNVKYLCANRQYSPSSLLGVDIGHGDHVRNGSDGFTMLTNLINYGFKNINVLGFSAFGSDEDMSYHSTYNCNGDPRFEGRKLFDLKTSEDLKAESDILKYWDKNKVINNIENHTKLLHCIGEI
jgi:hypothetical protein